MEPNMTKIFAGCGPALLALSLQMLAAGSAWAADLGEEKITVQGPYTVRTEMTKRSLGGEMPEFTISVSRDVNYADLDLSKSEDVAKLRDRVATAAKDSCRELDSRFPRDVYIPVNESSRKDCVRHATGQALARLDATTNGALARADTNNRQQVAAR
jgi:UrcA family protein